MIIIEFIIMIIIKFIIIINFKVLAFDLYVLKISLIGGNSGLCDGVLGH